MVESTWIRKAGKCCFCWHASTFKFINLYLYLQPFPSRCQDNFHFEADFAFLKFVDFICYIGFAILFDEQWQNCFYYRYVSVFQLLRLENYRLDFSIKISIESFRLYKNFRLSHQFLEPLRQNPDFQKTTVVANNIELFRTSNSWISGTTSMIWCIKISIERFILWKSDSIKKRFNFSLEGGSE